MQNKEQQRQQKLAMIEDWSRSGLSQKQYCLQHNIASFVWLRDVLQRIATHPINKIEELLPQNWQPLQRLRQN